jgi:hypothetical protein
LKKSKPHKFKLEISGCDSLAAKTDSDCSSSLTEPKIIKKSQLKIIRENEMSIHKSRKSSPKRDYCFVLNESTFLNNDVSDFSSKLLCKVDLSGNESTIACNKNYLSTYNLESIQINSNKLKNLLSDDNIKDEFAINISQLKSIEETHLIFVKAIGNSKRMISILEGNIVVDCFQTVVNLDETEL